MCGCGLGGMAYSFDHHRCPCPLPDGGQIDKNAAPTSAERSNKRSHSDQDQGEYRSRCSLCMKSASHIKLTCVGVFRGRVRG